MKNRTAVKVLFCAIITIICVNGCGSGNKNRQNADANAETLEVSDLETKEDSLNLPDSTPAVSRDSRLVNAEGEEWVMSGEHGFRAFVFKADGNYNYRYFVAGENGDRYIATGKWFTNNNKITLVLISHNDTTRVVSEENGDSEEYYDDIDDSNDALPYTVSDITIEIDGDTFRRQKR